MIDKIGEKNTKLLFKMERKINKLRRYLN